MNDETTRSENGSHSTFSLRVQTKSSWFFDISREANIVNENMHFLGSSANVYHYKGIRINFETVDKLSDRQKFDEFYFRF